MEKDQKTGTSYNVVIRGNPSSMILLLHGYGASKDDMTGISHLLDVQNCVFIIPNAPHPCLEPEIEIPFVGGFYWFRLNDLDLFDISESVNLSAKTLAPFLESMLERFNIPAQKAVVLGFSQGAMVACQLGATFKPRLGGVVAFSGSFSSVSIANEEINRDINYAVIHGKDDSVLPIRLGMQAAKELQKISSNVESLFLPDTDHVISQEGIDFANIAIGKYLHQKL